MSSELRPRFETLSTIPGLDQHLIQQLDDFVVQSPDEALFRVNPLAYASRMGLTDHQAIDLFVAAAHVGLFEFAWESLCLGCGGVLKEAAALSQIASHSHCALCDQPVDVFLDDAVEIAFTVSAQVRSIRFHHPERLVEPSDLWRLHFSQSWAAEPEFLASIQAATLMRSLAAGKSQTTCDLDLKPGIYRFVDIGHHGFVRFEVADEAREELQELTLELRQGILASKKTTLRPGTLRLTVRNHDTAPVFCLFVRSLEEEMVMMRKGEMRPPYMIPFLTGKRLLSNQLFRERFRAVTVQPGSRFEIRSLTFLFTDLKGSTELYDRIGDLQAYDLVQEHFRILTEIVARYEGAIVKTMGDAIMATFVDPAAAVRAAREMHQRLDVWNQQHREDDLTLKVGIHSGGCIVVNDQDRLDYFGQTVNVAARIQGLAGSRETFLSDAVYASVGVREVLTETNWQMTRQLARLKGVSEEVGVFQAVGV